VSQFDFESSRVPAAAPLRNSHTVGDIEHELKQVFLELFDALGQDSFDANVLGAAHLGSFDLVRRMVNHDGLVLLPGEREEAATRYLYRAWKSGDVQKRGLHFVRTYLQLLFPGQAEVRQLWHRKGDPYGTSFIKNEPRDPYWFHFLGAKGLKLDASWRLGQPLSDITDSLEAYKPDETDLFLTSRIEILLGLESIAEGRNSLTAANRPVTTGLLDVIRAVIPARLVPMFRFWLRFVLGVQVRMSTFLTMDKQSRMRYPWCGRVITVHDDASWKLGRDGDLVALPQPFGSFKLGERRGGFSDWRLKACRIASEGSLVAISEQPVFGITKLGTPWLRLDRTWSLGRYQSVALSQAEMSKTAAISQEYDSVTTFAEHHVIAGPVHPQKLGAYVKTGRWRLNGDRGVGSLRTGSQLGRFKLGRTSPAVDYYLSASVTGAATAGPVFKLDGKLALDGGWHLSERKIQGASLVDLIKRVELAQSISLNTTTFHEEIEFRYPQKPERLARVWPLAAGWRLQGQKLGVPAERKGFPMPLHQDRILVETQSDIEIQSEITHRAPIALPPSNMPRLANRQRKLDGRWPVAAYSRFGRFRLDGAERLRTRKTTTARPLGSFTLAPDEYSGRGIADRGAVFRRPLNGDWSLGSPATPEFTITITHV